MAGERYPIKTLADMAAIPDDVLPRFLAELPAILGSFRQMDAAQPHRPKATP